MTAHAESPDKREVFTGEVYPWLRAVGKLQVPAQRPRDGHLSHYREDCSATLIAKPGRSHADIIVTAWHCLELYRDMSRPIIFTTTTRSGEILQREARRLADGGGMHADWAILRLHRTVPADTLAGLSIRPDETDAGRSITMAGYSRDEGLGRRGQVLTFDANCRITSGQRLRGTTNCVAYKGASGGAVTQFSVSGEVYFQGVISQGNGEGLSTFVPVRDFRREIERFLR